MGAYRSGCWSPERVAGLRLTLTHDRDQGYPGVLRRRSAEAARGRHQRPPITATSVELRVASPDGGPAYDCKSAFWVSCCHHRRRRGGHCDTRSLLWGI